MRKHVKKNNFYINHFLYTIFRYSFTCTNCNKWTSSLYSKRKETKKKYIKVNNFMLMLFYL